MTSSIKVPKKDYDLAEEHKLLILFFLLVVKI